VSDLELKRKESLPKAEVAKRLSAFAEALASGDDVELEMGGTSISMRVPHDVRMEFEVEVDGDEIEIEIELTWSTSAAAARAKSAPEVAEESDAEGKDKGERSNGKRSRRT
jgi:amphi-Trp domain-containing protein